MRAHLATAVACALLVAGCNDSSHAPENARPLALLVRQDAEPAGGNCPAGGVVVRAGLDANGDDVLQDEEVAKTSYACDAVLRPVLTRTVALDAGALCPDGGTRVEAGRDADGDGLLEDGEVEQDAALCAPPDAPALFVDTVPASATAECPLGGTAVRAGFDRDGSGSLTYDEVAELRVVCSRVSYGFTVESQDDVRLLTAAVAVKGDVIVESPTLTGVFLYPDKILGSIVIRNSPALEYVWLENYGIAGSGSGSVAIRGSLIVTDNPALKSVSFPHASYPTYHPNPASRIGGDLVVARNASLSPGMWELSDLARVDGSIVFEENASLPSLTLDGLLQVGGSLRILRNPAFEAGPPHGGSVVAASFIGGDVEIDGAGEGLIDLTRLGSLGGSLSVRNASSLLLYASQLRVVFGSVRLDDNGGIGAAFDRLLSIEGDLSLSRNTLDRVSRFDQLEWIGGGLSVSDNPQLRDLGLPALRGASVLTLARNPVLADPRGHMSSLQKLESLGALVVADDAALATLPLPALVSLGQLSVSGAPRLPSCEVEQLVARAHPTAVSVTGTDDLATCP